MNFGEMQSQLLKKFPEFSSHKEWTDKIDMSGSSVKSDCCAQFVVDRDRVKRLPKEAWETLQREVLQADDRSSQCFHLERMWAPLFGEPAIIPILCKHT